MGVVTECFILIPIAVKGRKSEPAGNKMYKGFEGKKEMKKMENQNQ